MTMREKDRKVSSTKYAKDNQFQFRSRKKVSKPVSDQIVLDTTEYEKRERQNKIYFCMYCKREMDKIDLGDYYCGKCDIAFSPDKEVVRERTILTTAREDIEPAASSTIDDDYTSSTNYGKPIKVKGSFQMLQNKGVKITNYTETDGNGRTITHRPDEEEEEEEDYY